MVILLPVPMDDKMMGFNAIFPMKLEHFGKIIPLLWPVNFLRNTATIAEIRAKPTF
jgi:hypothetical protein